MVLTVVCFMSSFWVVDIDRQVSHLFKNSVENQSFLTHGPNISLVRCMAMVWFMLWLSLFLRSDIENIKLRNAVKGLVLSSLTFLIVAWLMSNAILNDKSHSKLGSTKPKIEGKLPSFQWSTIRILIISTIDALFISAFIVCKFFKIINL